MAAAKIRYSYLKDQPRRRVAARQRGPGEAIISTNGRNKTNVSAMGKPRGQQQETPKPKQLKGWRQIATFLGEPTSVAQRWAAQGMPVRRQGRYVTTTPDQLNAWLERESGKPVHVATNDTDLTAELRRGISFLRREQQVKPPRSKRS